MSIVIARVRAGHRDLHAAVRNRRLRTIRRRVAGGSYEVDVAAVSDAIARRAGFCSALAGELVSSRQADEARS